MKKMLSVLTLLIVFIVSSCASVPEKKSETAEKEKQSEKLQKKNEKSEEKKETAEDFGEKGNEFIKWCRNELEKTEEMASELKSSQKKNSASEILDSFNKIEIKQYDVYCSAGINQFNHPDDGMRNAARICSRELNVQQTDFALDKELYEIFKSISKEDESLTEEDINYLEDVLADYKRNGVNKDEKTRKQLQELSSELTELYQKFHANISSGTKYVVIEDPSRLEGLPEDFIASRKTDDDGNIVLSTDWPDYFPILESAEDRSLREKMYRARRSVAFPENTEVFSKILEKRQKWSEILGYKNWAEYTQEKLMIGNPGNAHDFITKTHKITSDYVDGEIDMLLKYSEAYEEDSEKELELWDIFFLQNLAKKDQYDFDPAEARKYFEISKVIEGVFEVMSKIYNIEIKEVQKDDVWHPDVKSYDVVENGKVIGHFELDLYPRPNKYKHFAMFTNRLGVKDIRLPRGAIIGNFPEPSNGKAYVNHHDVETIFHEFGHLIHMIFAGNQKYLRFSGTRCQRDFVEVPSNLFEEWAWNASVLRMFATDDEGNPIPETLVEKMNAARKTGNAIRVARQMYLAMLSLEIFRQDTESFNHREFEKEIERKYSPTKVRDNIPISESFGHLIGYSSNYYTYMWSKVIAEDMLSYIREQGLMNSEVMTDFKEKVLSRGGSVDGNRMIEDFLGREMSFEAFEKWLAE
ncbi:MAG: M3 family metallopeptidase [bacterium]